MTIATTTAPKSRIKPMQILNQELQNLTWNYFESEGNQYVEVNDTVLMVFDKSASGNAKMGSKNWLANKHMDGQIHEPATVAAFVAMKTLFQEKINVVYDIGALYGYFSVMSAALFPGSEVLAFEMNPRSHDALTKNIELNEQMFHRNIHPVNVGLSDVSALSLPVVIDGFILNEKSDNGQATADDHTNVIDILTMDHYTKMSGKKPDLIKLDVEGYQTKIIPGGLDTIATSKPAVIMEFDHISRMNEMQSNNREIANYFFDLGYHCWWIGDQRNGRGEFIKIQSSDIDMSKEINSLAVFVHNDWL